MIIKRKSIENKTLPQLQDLKKGETFQLTSDSKRVFMLTDFEGDDFNALFRYRYGSDDNTVCELINNEPENEGKNKCPGLYCVAVNIATGEFTLFHKSVEAVPVNCELYFQEKEKL